MAASVPHLILHSDPSSNIIIHIYVSRHAYMGWISAAVVWNTRCTLPVSVSHQPDNQHQDDDVDDTHDKPWPACREVKVHHNMPPSIQRPPAIQMHITKRQRPELSPAAARSCSCLCSCLHARGAQFVYIKGTSTPSGSAAAAAACAWAASAPAEKHGGH